MIGKVKSFLGIESVKIELETPFKIPHDGDFLMGTVILNSKSNQTIKSITIKLIEKYQRGIRKNKLINEYTVGVFEYEKPLIIEANKELTFEFKMKYNVSESEMDKIGSQNFITKTFVKFAKILNNVKSEFRLEASAKIAGNAISPLTKKEIKVIF